jgi:hypothetical protein
VRATLGPLHLLTFGEALDYHGFRLIPIALTWRRAPVAEDILKPRITHESLRKPANPSSPAPSIFPMQPQPKVTVVMIAGPSTMRRICLRARNAVRYAAHS